MGKDWLYRGGAGSSKAAKRGRFVIREETEAPPSGCMCAVLQMFDLNHFQFPLHHHQSFRPDALLEEETSVSKGLEAPRNSLELEEPSCLLPAPVSSTMKEDANLNHPVGIQIRTSCDSRSPRESTSECGSSPGTKTPGLVARLMGLDLLPEAASPSSSSSRLSTPNNGLTRTRFQQHHGPNRSVDRARHLLQNRSSCSSNRSYIDKNDGGTRSLPETPRVSSSRRSDEDHRLSLQINKENGGEEFDLAAYIAKKVARRREARQEEENRSPSHYARQIVKQVKESVSRRVGTDITNTIKNRERAKDEHVVLLKPKKLSSFSSSSGDENCPSKQSTPSCSPRLRFLETKNKSQTTHSPKFSSSSSSPCLGPIEDKQSPEEKIPAIRPRPTVQFPTQQTYQEKSVQKCEKVGSERYNSRLKKPPQGSDAIRNKKEEQFIRSPSKNKASPTDKTCKKIPLSNELLNNNVPTLLAVKKDHSFPATKLIHKQSQESDAFSSKRITQLPCYSSQSYNQEATRIPTTRENIQDRRNGTATSFSGNGEEYQYIQRIIKRTGIDRGTPVSLAKWYSPSHPLDPAIFHYIELFHHTNTIFISKTSKLKTRANRKLIFQLADELLAEILKPYIDFKPWVRPNSQRCQMDGSELMEILCSRIQDFPSANCQVLEDIDALVDQDLGKSQLRRSDAFEEEGNGIVSEIERDIVDALVRETALEMLARRR